MWLDQGWSREDSGWFYKTTQGSQILPYPFFTALEQEAQHGAVWRGAEYAEVPLSAGERRVNASSVPCGFARLDAFDRIFNNALTLVDKRNGVKPNASVSYPHLWDAPREDYVQWTGIAPNAGIGPLTRNVGEVVGVFAHIDPGPRPPSLGYDTSVRVKNLIALEDRLKSLRSPEWPEKILGALDPALKTKGGKVFKEHCATCHEPIDRTGSETVKTHNSPISELQTDALTAQNILNGRGKTGFLKGTWQLVITGDRFGDEAPALTIVTNTVLRTLIGAIAPAPVLLDDRARLIRLNSALAERKIDASKIMNRDSAGPKLEYKARPLNGIWATAPYLHNGSVPSLAELLLPPEQRSKKFAVGRREFDPQNVGFQTGDAPGTFTFDTAAAGNANTGHRYGAKLSADDRRALLEYLKSI